MDFGFSDEQEQLRLAAREFFERETPTGLARQMMDDPIGVREELWHSLAGLGWVGIAVAERYGGSGQGNLELALVMEEAGRVVLALPLASTAALAMPALARFGTEEQCSRFLPNLCSGRMRLTLAAAEEEGAWTAAAIATEAEPFEGGWRIDGEKLFVPDAGGADAVIVAARLRDGTGLLVVPRDAAGLEVEPMVTVDATRKLFAVRLQGVEVDGGALLGGRPLDEVEFGTLIDVAKTMLAAELCGLADRALELSVEYAKIREQFGRPIGSFQAIQHKLADMKVAVENAKSLVYYAAWALDRQAPDVRLAAAMAKAYASAECPKVIADAIQAHGGIGFTWEHDLHLYYKRAKADEVTYGDAVENQEFVAALLPLDAP